MTRGIRIECDFVGIHHWPEAPKKVDHLRNLHSHVFKVKADLLVDHADRNVEFFIAREDLVKAVGWIKRDLKANPAMSCEMMAEAISNTLVNYGKYKVFEVSVAEPGIGEGYFRP